MLEKKVENLKKVSKRRLQRINTLTKRVTRLQKKNADLYTVVLDKLRLENVETKYINMVDGINKNHVIKRFLQKQYDDVLTREYSLEIKKIAVTLHYLSPKAYSFVREQFENVLPKYYHTQKFSVFFPLCGHQELLQLMPHYSSPDPVFVDSLWVEC
ncbi:hypothetical protein MSG28_011176 [Choristoneura fumiferana]|uniref:Uncharacterized protein n=1 Tax=Choristoneura fumiferana TaxID=7141 RepID=A0ACC0KRM6_CHOFU|nr:hypothetical protein MSG28_011176 [Choristoneura fumiferana]